MLPAKKFFIVLNFWNKKSSHICFFPRMFCVVKRTFVENDFFEKPFVFDKCPKNTILNKWQFEVIVARAIFMTVYSPEVVSCHVSFYRTWMETYKEHLWRTIFFENHLCLIKLTVNTKCCFWIFVLNSNLILFWIWKFYFFFLLHLSFKLFISRTRTIL